MGLFDDVLYPNNKERYHRVEEVANDIASLTYDVSSTFDRIQKKAEEVNERFSDLLAILGEPLPELEEVEFEFEGVKVAFYLAETVVGMLTFSLAYKALGKAAVAYLLRKGAIGPAALSRLVGFPKWITLGRVAGGIAAVVVGELIISAIQGATTRANLRGAINEILPPRVDLKHKALINADTFLSLSTLAASFEVLKELGEFDIETLRKLYESLAEKHKERIENITYGDALRDLASLDRSRGSWTNEDPDIDSSETRKMKLTSGGKPIAEKIEMPFEAYRNPVVYDTIEVLTTIGYKKEDIQKALLKQ
ncbi:hypothetical protein [Aquimarina sp. 2201CG5-10]|uniref:hypothetical protein n=1 Tax=Aquimarina callyspongiae TaxID=3098150 RepID=UPI002AB41553|nr:hypothetical protein [Aquimarina sp. 2201CG5-10]MDY8137380.1 hypothetical protein [Aquimarina sp. 2201CG5-10]